MKKNVFGCLIACLCISASALAQEKFNGIDANMSNIFRLSDAKTRSISPENFKGEKGKGGMAVEGTGKSASRDLGQGWKVSPSVVIKAKTTFTVAEIDGSGFHTAYLDDADRRMAQFYSPFLLGWRNNAIR